MLPLSPLRSFSPKHLECELSSGSFEEFLYPYKISDSTRCCAKLCIGELLQSPSLVRTQMWVVHKYLDRCSANDSPIQVYNVPESPYCYLPHSSGF